MTVIHITDILVTVCVILGMISVTSALHDFSNGEFDLRPSSKVLLLLSLLFTAGSLVYAIYDVVKDGVYFV